MIDGRRLVALLLVGGAGTRLWPVSSEEQPKQFLKLFHTRSLFQATLVRIAEVADDVIVVTGAAYAPVAIEQVAELGLSPPRLLLEPMRRDSAAAISAGVAWVAQQIDPDALIAVLPADHHIPDVAAFTRALAQGASLAADGWLVTFGVRPSAPSSEYGYVQRGEPLSGGLNYAYRVAKFHEKPRPEVAESYLRAGNYDWNSGMFLFAAGRFIAEALLHMPDIWEPAASAAAAARPASLGIELDAAFFAAARKSSIDYALFEKSDRVAVVPVGFEWHDIGNWGSAYAAFSPGRHDNLSFGDAVLDDVSGAVVVADRVKVVVCGLSDIVVVSSPQGTFVAPRSRAAEIKRLLGG